MSKRSNPVDHGDPSSHRGSGDDDDGLRLWTEGDEDETTGRNWSLILILAVVPMMTLVALALSLVALYSEAFGQPAHVETVIDSEDRQS